MLTDITKKEILDHLPSLKFVFMFIICYALIHDTICGEGGKGTLKLSPANSVPRDRSLLGKTVGGYIIPLLFPLLSDTQKVMAVNQVRGEVIKELNRVYPRLPCMESCYV